MSNWATERDTQNSLNAFKIQRANDKTGGVWGYAAQSTFGNCQNWTIGYFGTILAKCQDEGEDIVAAVRDIKSKVSSGKDILIVDILESDYESIADKFTFLNTMPYTNLTGSEMRICMIDLR